jgi:hypothetical protein
MNESYVNATFALGKICATMRVHGSIRGAARCLGDIYVLHPQVEWSGLVVLVCRLLGASVLAGDGNG